MGRINNVRRTACTVAATAALIAGTIVAGAGPASATLADDGIFVACPDKTTLTYETTTGCESLAAAVTDAEAWSQVSRSSVTIDLLPGQYCPVALPYDIYDITIQGLGFAGLADPSDASSYSGFEADLSELTWIPGTCQGSPTAFLTNLPSTVDPNQIWGELSLQNFSINGANGVSDGIDVTNAGLGMRDMLVENLTGDGVHYQDPANFYNGGIQNSAFVGNGIGTAVSTGANHGFSINESTFAENGTGVSGSSLGASIAIGGDTIGHNTTGLSGTFGQVAASIVGDNATNCSTTSYQDFHNNDYGPGCITSTGDASLSSLGSVSTSGPAVTPSIAPPGEAANLVDDGICVTTQDDVDQEETSVFGQNSCYAGSIQPTITPPDPPTAAPSPQDFGIVATNEPASTNVSLSSVGGITDVTGVDLVKTSGTGSLTLNFTNCEFFLLYMQFNRGSCFASVTATAVDSSGETDGTLTFHTGSGDVVDDLTFTGGPPIVAPAAPTNLTGTAKDHELDLSWNLTPVADDGGQPIQSYEADYSLDNGSTWHSLYTDDDTTDDPASIAISFDIHNNRTYQLRVTANNGFATSDPSNTISLTPGVPTSIAAPANKTIRWGTPTTIKTKVISDGQPVVAKPVQLQKRPAGTTTWTAAGSATTGSGGIASLTIAPVHTTAYRWYFAGDTNYIHSTSAAATIQVSQVITAKLSAASVKHAKPVNVYGTVQPSAAHQKVSVQQKKAGGWKTVGTATLVVQKLPNGKKALGYVFSYRPRTKGKQTLRVTKAATATNGAGTSPPVTVKVT